MMVAKRLPVGLYRCLGCGLETLLPRPCLRVWCSRCERDLERVGNLPRRKFFNRWTGRWKETDSWVDD